MSNSIEDTTTNYDSSVIDEKSDERPASLKFSFVEIEDMGNENGTPCDAVGEEYDLFKVLRHLLPTKAVFLGVRHKTTGFSFSFLQQVKYGSSKCTSAAHYFLAVYLPGEATVEEGDSPPFMCLLLKVQEYDQGASERIFSSFVEEVPLSALGLQNDAGPWYVKNKHGDQIAPMTSRFGDEILVKMSIFLQSRPEQRQVCIAISRNEIVASKAAERDRKFEEAEINAAELKAEKKRLRVAAAIKVDHDEVNKEKKFKRAASMAAIENRFSDLEARLETNIKELHESKKNFELHSYRVTKLECDSANILASCKIMHDSILSMRDTMKCDKDAFGNHISKVQDQVSINEWRTRKSMQAIKKQGDERNNDLYEFLHDNHKSNRRQKRFQPYAYNYESDDEEF
jgi:hypothetical protein